MKAILLTLLLFSAKAFSWTDFELPRAVSFIEKKKTCKIAIGLNDTQEFLQRNFTNEIFNVVGGSIAVPKATTSFTPKPNTGIPAVSSIVCIQDLVENQGAINEKEGCTMIWYYLENNAFGKLISSSSKLCQKGGYEELIPAIKDFAYKAAVGFGSDQLESAPGLKIFGIKTWSLVRTENPSISNFFAPHMNTNQQPTVAQLNSWKEFLKKEVESRALNDARRAKEEVDAKNKEEKIRQKENKKRKDREKLYE